MKMILTKKKYIIGGYPVYVYKYVHEKDKFQNSFCNTFMIMQILLVLRLYKNLCVIKSKISFIPKECLITIDHKRKVYNFNLKKSLFIKNNNLSET